MCVHFNHPLFQCVFGVVGNCSEPDPVLSKVRFSNTKQTAKREKKLNKVKLKKTRRQQKRKKQNIVKRK